MYLDLQAREYNARMDDKNCAKRISFLEEEIKELKEQIERERNFAAEAIITRGKDFQPEIDDLKEEIEELKEENETLKENYEQIDNSSFLKIKELKSANVFLKDTTDIAWRQIEELKEENEEQSSIIEKLDDRLVNLRAMKKDITLHPDYKRLVELD